MATNLTTDDIVLPSALGTLGSLASSDGIVVWDASEAIPKTITQSNLVSSMINDYENITLTWAYTGTSSDMVRLVCGNFLFVQLEFRLTTATTITSGTTIATLSGLPTTLATRTQRCVIAVDTSTSRYNMSIDIVIVNGQSTADIIAYANDGISKYGSITDVAGFYGGGTFLCLPA